MRPWFNRSGSSTWFGRDDVAIYLLVIANVVIFGLCIARSMPGGMSTAVLLEAGAISPSTLAKGETWRLVAHGFLHLNPLHLGTNMLCLVLFGGPLIRRVKTLYFLVIYLVSVVAGGIVSIHLHGGPFVSVGASGGVSGLLGALACLWILGRAAVPLTFLIANIGLNVVLSSSAANIDWASHLGGFTGGLIACAVLDLVEKVNGQLLQCKFPEFIKVNGAGLLGAPLIAGLAAGIRLPDLGEWAAGTMPALAYAAACLGLIKLTDLVLPLKKGLAVVILMIALGNAVLVWSLGMAFAPALSSACERAGVTLPENPAVNLLCLHRDWTVMGTAAACFFLTLLIYSWDLRRGLKDVGFIGATLKAERRRSQGL